MCLAAILVSRVSTLVMGSRQSLGRWGPYTVERFLKDVNWSDTLSIVAGVLPGECVEIYRRWGGPEPGTPPNTRPTTPRGAPR
jgi:tRNA(Arg) A34 adenosine deaminase TadA